MEELAKVALLSGEIAIVLLACVYFLNLASPWSYALLFCFSLAGVAVLAVAQRFNLTQNELHATGAVSVAAVLLAGMGSVLPALFIAVPFAAQTIRAKLS